MFWLRNTGSSDPCGPFTPDEIFDRIKDGRVTYAFEAIESASRPDEALMHSTEWVVVHEVIKQHQRDQSSRFADCKPSEVTDVYWIYGTRKQGQYPKATIRSGKLLVPVPIEKLDETWASIKAATESGNLGDSSKVRTAQTNASAQDPHEKVICVYTYDKDDLADVERIKQALCELGITQGITYKSDQKTLEDERQLIL